MNGSVKLARCAIYTRKSTEYNLELAFNSLDAQREACEAYIKSQAHDGWRLIPGRYDDGAFSGASLDRPALQQLLADVRAGKIGVQGRPAIHEVFGISSRDWQSFYHFTVGGAVEDKRLTTLPAYKFEEKR